jgi:hypothetical protein
MSKTWKGEHEWRCVRIYTGAGRDFWEASLPYTAIRSNILGANATDQTRTRLFKWADDMLGDNFCIEIRESVADRGAWMFSNIPTRERLCTCCNGRGTTHKSERATA